MLLARMIYFYLPTHSIFSIPASVLALAFVSLDFVSFVIQIIGGSYAGPTAPMAQQLKGVHIYMGGIGLQQFFIFIFLALGVKFHREMLKREYTGRAKQGWKRLLFTLYASLGFITVSLTPSAFKYHEYLAWNILGPSDHTHEQATDFWRRAIDKCWLRT